MNGALTFEQVEASQPVRPDAVDTDHRGTCDTSARGRWRDWQVERLEPAWFIPREKSLARLSRRLLSEASPTSGAANKSLTYRLAAILDWQTGVVYLVSVFHSCGVTRVTRFSQEFGRVYGRRVIRSIGLAEVLCVTMAGGRRRFEVIGCARTKEPTEYYLQTFSSRREFREFFSGPVMQAQRAVQSGARVCQVRMEAFGAELGAQCQALELTEESQAELESDTEPEELESVSEPDPECESWLQAEAYSHERALGCGRLRLNPSDVWLLREWMPSFTTVDELVDLLCARHPDGRLVIGDELYQVIEQIAGADVSFFTMAEQFGMEQTLNAYGY